jgi:hypothetical protein
MFIAAIIILGACWVASAFIKNRLYSSGVFALGAFLFFVFMLVGCHRILQDFSHVQ